MGIDIDDFASALAKELSNYSLDVAKQVRQAVQEESKKMLKDIKRDSPKRTGSYKKAMALKTEVDNVYELKKRWYVKDPDYRVSHLLEYGHDVTKEKRGPKIGEARPKPHIEKNEDKAQKAFYERVVKIFENAGK